MERKLTCIVCPLGCDLVATIENGTVTHVSGHTCPRGKRYAETECIDPKRTVTSTMLCTDGGMVAVKTDTAIPKDRVMECMEILNRSTATLPITIGDVLLEDVCGSRIVATQNRP